MKNLFFVGVLAAGCAPTNYYYNFDLTDPGAQNLSKPGQRDTLEDDSIKAEILVDPTTFQAISFDVTNKTSQIVEVQWTQINMIGPDGSTIPVHPDADLGWIQPGTRMAARLVPFSLPPSGSAAAAYDGQTFQLQVPMVVGGQPKVYQYHLIVHMQKL
jgi:hypothetical protein